MWHILYIFSTVEPGETAEEGQQANDDYVLCTLVWLLQANETRLLDGGN